MSSFLCVSINTLIQFSAKKKKILNTTLVKVFEMLKLLSLISEPWGGQFLLVRILPVPFYSVHSFLLPYLLIHPFSLIDSHMKFIISIVMPYILCFLIFFTFIKKGAFQSRLELGLVQHKPVVDIAKLEGLSHLSLRKKDFELVDC